MSFSLSLSSQTVTEGGTLSFDVTPLLALGSDTTITWEIVSRGKIVARSSDFATTTGSLNFASGATQAQSVTVMIAQDSKTEEAEQFAIRLKQGSDVIAESALITITDDETDRAIFGNLDLFRGAGDDVVTFGDTARFGSATGGEGDDVFVVTAYQSGDITITDLEGQNLVKFDFDVVITHVEAVFVRNRYFSTTITLETGGKVKVQNLQTIGLYHFQIGDGEVLSFVDFLATISAGGFVADTTNGELVSPFEIVRYVEFTSAADVTVNENQLGEIHQITLKRQAVYEFELSGADAASFTISNEGKISLASGVTLDADGAKTSYSLIVTATTPEGRSNTQNVTITLTDLNDVAPAITSGATGTALAENTEVSATTAVYTATGTYDVDAIVWSLKAETGDVELFDIDSATGAVTFNTATTPDYEGKSSYSFTIVATSGTLTAEQAVTIAVTDIDDNAPVIGGTITGTVTEDAAVSTATGTLTVTDADGTAANKTTTVTAPSNLVGTYGSIAFDGNSWTYTLNNADNDTQALNGAASVTDTFTVNVDELKTSIDVYQMSVTLFSDQSDTDLSSAVNPTTDDDFGYRIFGPEGDSDDTLIGSAYNDLFEMREGDDTVTGNGGDDVFAYQFTQNASGAVIAHNFGDDPVTDFEFGRDVVLISDVSDGLASGGTQDNRLAELHADGVTFSLITSETEVTGVVIALPDGASGTGSITINFADDSKFDLNNLLAQLGISLGTDETLQTYFTDDSTTTETEYKFTQVAMTEAIFDNLFGEDGFVLTNHNETGLI